MRRSGIPAYPALGRFFDSMDQLAHAACIGRTQLYRIRKGEADFTPSQKSAIVADIMARMYVGQLEQEEEINLQSLYFAYNGHFDEFFKSEAKT